jgi:hypothetical protein
LILHIAAKDLPYYHRFRLEDVVLGFRLVALADVAVTVGCPRQHGGRTRSGAIDLSTPGALGDLSPLVLRDHALKLQQQLVLRRVRLGPFEKSDFCPRSAELLHQESLIHVLPRQAIR